MSWEEIAKFLASPEGKIAIPALTFVVGGICGFIATRFTMPADKREELKDRRHQIGVSHQAEKDKAYAAFCNALKRYIDKADEPSLDDFFDVSTTGDLYFSRLKIMADAVITGNVDTYSRDNNFVPDICEAIEKTIPAYYDALAKISARIGSPYTGRFERRGYESLFIVAEKYGASKPPHAANTLPTPG